MRADHRGILLNRRTYSAGLFSVVFQAPGLAAAVRSGQFAMVEVPGRLRPYLRRAYSVADARPEAGEVEFLVRAIGPGTSALETLAEGSAVSLLGPLGNGFSTGDLARRSRVAIVAGGVGAAPFPLLFRELERIGAVGDFFFGGRSAADLALAVRFEGRPGGRTILASDDGSLGERGFVTDAFQRHAAEARYQRVYACGPMPMFGALARSLASHPIPAEFSTEAEMGCGFGVCLGCVLPGTEKPFIISCTEGPVLPPEKVRW